MTTILAFIVAIGILVTIHELGHYWVARLCNVKILRFSVGFGPSLWMRKFGRDQTEWVIAAVPLGGYVRMADERDEDVQPADLPRAYNRQSVWKRSAIVLAGPLANLALAWLLYWGLFMHGMPGLKPYIATPAANSAAAKAGLKNGDLLRRIGTSEIASWADVRWVLLQAAAGQPQGGARIEVEAEDEQGRITVRHLDLSDISADDLDRDFTAKLGLRTYQPTFVVGDVAPGTPAALAGLTRGDRIVSIDGQPIQDWPTLVAKVSAKAGEAVLLEWLKAGNPAERMQARVVPLDEKLPNGGRVGRIGVGVLITDAERAAVNAKLQTTVSHGFLPAGHAALSKVWETSVFSLSMLGKMVTGDVSWRNLSGPITIADYAGKTAKAGLVAFLTFLALVSVSIGVLNLLPIPVLDGGQLVYHLIEIFKGSPVSERVLEAGQQAGLFLLLGLTAFALYNDIQRLIVG